jgi:hypothetical protein
MSSYAIGVFHRFPLPLSLSVSVRHRDSAGPLAMLKPHAPDAGSGDLDDTEAGVKKIALRAVPAPTGRD